MSKIFNIHSCYKKTSEGDVVVVKEHKVINDKEIPTLRSFRNPKRTFFVTKPVFRNHSFNKELEDIDKLDRYVVNQYALYPKIQEALGMYGRVDRKTLFASPYLYGADIDIQDLVKMKYINEHHKGANPKITYGFLDIEEDTDNGDIILITFCTHDGYIFTAMLDSYMYLEEGKNRVKYTEELVHRTAREQLDEFWESHKLKLYTYVGKTPIDLVKWIFEQINKVKVDFIGIWNLDYDILEILKCIKNSRFSYEDIMIPKEVPYDTRFVNYRQDRSKVDHFTLKWHWLATTGYSQFIDSMCLFSLCRKTQGYRRKYTLDAILKEEINRCKLSLGEEGSHYIMRTKRFLDYTIYNIFDAFSMILLEEKNKDIFNMYMLSGVTNIASFPRATVKAKNSLYNSYIKEGKIVGTASVKNKMYTLKALFKNSGGTVLQPERTSKMGLNILQ
jgi:hypothetical protein